MNYRGLMILWNFPRLLNQRNHEGGGGEGNDFSAADGKFCRHTAVPHGGGKWKKTNDKFKVKYLECIGT